MIEWQVKFAEDVKAHGPMSTFPEAAQRKCLAAAGYNIYVDGKLFRASGKNAS